MTHTKLSSLLARVAILLSLYMLSNGCCTLASANFMTILAHAGNVIIRRSTVMEQSTNYFEMFSLADEHWTHA
jgi:hypothetical protein